MPDLTGANGNRENFRVVGKPNLPGHTAYMLATGIAKYGADYAVPNMLFAKILRSPFAHARVLSIDTTAALAIDGVVEVMLWDDPLFDEITTNPFGGKRPKYLPQEVHQEGGEVGAVVIAESEALCEEGLLALKVEWEELPFIVDIGKGLDPDLPTIRGPEWDESNMRIGPASVSVEGYGWMTLKYPDDPPKTGNVRWSNKVEGDLKAGWAEADFTLEYDLNIQDLVSLLPNPQASVSWWDRTMYKHGETLHIEGAVDRRPAIASMYQLPIDNVIQEGLFQGGKYCDWGLRMSQEITPLLSKKVGGRPVRCCNTREENFDLNRNERRAHVKLGVTKEGLITVVEDTSIVDIGVPTSSTMTQTDRDWNGYYTLKCENIMQNHAFVDSNRGYMHTCGQHVSYSYDLTTVGLYLIAEKLGKDPTEIARLNIHGPLSQKDKNPLPSFDICLERGKELMDWDWHPAGTKRLPDGRMHGASFRYQHCARHGGLMRYFCKLEYRAGVVHFPTQGPVAGWFGTECFTMIIAEELGLEYDDICVDYDYRAEHDDKAGGSDGVTGKGWIVKECANVLKQKILHAAVRYANNLTERNAPAMVRPLVESPLRGFKAVDLDIMDGKVYVKSDPSKFVPLSKATTETITADYGGYSPKAHWPTTQGRSLDTMNTSWCEVAVDEETGEVEILKYLVVPDVGKVIRRTSLESQIDQVIYLTHGSQLMQELIMDPATGVKLNGNMIDYRHPTMADIPIVDKDIIESRLGGAAYGASGISHNLANSHQILAAIHNATGVWVESPATPDRVLKALGKC